MASVSDPNINLTLLYFSWCIFSFIHRLLHEENKRVLKKVKIVTPILQFKRNKCVRKKRFYPAVVPGHKRLLQVSWLNPLPWPGLEAHSLGWRSLRGSCCPHGRVQTVNNDVLHGLRAQQVDEVHLDATHSHLQLKTERINIKSNDVKSWLLLSFSQNSLDFKTFNKEVIFAKGNLEPSPIGRQ